MTKFPELPPFPDLAKPLKSVAEGIKAAVEGIKEFDNVGEMLKASLKEGKESVEKALKRKPLS